SHSILGHGGPQNVITVDGFITARLDGGCTSSNVVSAPTDGSLPLKRCNYAGADTDPNGADPMFQPAVPNAPAAAPAPTCVGKAVDFSPGTYTSTPTALATTAGCLAKNVYWFHPGSYYFNFTAPLDSWDVP